MNLRIKEIGQQAGFTFIGDHVFGQRWYSSKCGLDAAEYEKLVELIVQECVAICQDTDGDDSIDARSGRQDCAVEIREHFGVKE